MPDIRISVKLPDLSKFDGKVFIDRIAKAQRDKTRPALQDLFRKTVEGWEHKPNFSVEQNISTSSISMRVFASGQNADQYALVVKGSRPHTITARTGRFLKYQSGYRAGTRPRMLSSRSKQRFGPYVMGGQTVKHPGFEGRAFDEVIAEIHYPDFVKDMQDAMKP